MDTYESEVRRTLTRNYTFNLLDGLFVSAGMTCVAADSVLPALVKQLGGSDWLVALMPSAFFIGLGWPSLFTSHYAEQLPRLKPFIVPFGLFFRLPFLVAAFALLFLWHRHPVWTLVIVAATPFVSGVINGLTITAWMELIARIIPEERRASSWAWRAIAGSAAGIGAGAMVKIVLSEWPGMRGYGILHLLMFVLSMLSFACFILIREPSAPYSARRSAAGGVRLRDNLKSMPGLLRSDRFFTRFLLSNMLASGLLALTPFLAIHCLQSLQKQPDFVGVLVAVQMTGSIAGNLAAAWLGDRRGGKLPLMLGRGAIVIVAIMAAAAASEPVFLVIFFLVGFGVNCGATGATTLGVELCPLEKRPTYQALLSVAGIPPMLIASALGAGMRGWRGDLLPAAVFVSITLVLSMYFLHTVPEPRVRRSASR